MFAKAIIACRTFILHCSVYNDADKINAMNSTDEMWFGSARLVI